MLFAASSMTPSDIGSISPFSDPAKISSVTGFPHVENIAVETQINPIIQ